MRPTPRQLPLEVAPETFLIRAVQQSLGSALSTNHNSLVIRATEPVIVDTGTLKVGMPFICGPYSGRVKTLINDLGESVKQAAPGTPVEVIGFEELPHVGDELVEMESDRAAKKLAEERQQERRAERLKVPQKSRMEDLFSHVTDFRSPLRPKR